MLFEPIKPMLLTMQRNAFDDERWLHEIKWDGFRILVHKQGKRIEAYTRHGNCVTSKFPELYDAAQSIRSHTAILDCEGICLRDDRSVFDDFAYRGRLTNPKAIQRAVETHPASFVVFDVLYTNRDHTKEPLTTRKTWLDDIILPSAAIAPTLYVDGAGLELQKMTQDRGLEGIVAKAKDSRYSLNVRSKSWLKIKNFKTMDVVILGYRREPRFALVVGVFDSGEGHHGPVAVVEFGFKPEEKVAFLKVVKEIHTVKERHAQWIEPRLCARVQFLERTERRHLRMASFKGFLPGKKPEECRWIS